MNYINFSAGEKEYKLALTTRGMVELEKKIGCNPVNLLIAASDDRVPQISEMVAVLWASMQKYNHGVKFDDCYDIFDEWLDDGNKVVEFLDIIVEIYQVSGLIGDSEEADPNAAAGE